MARSGSESEMTEPCSGRLWFWRWPPTRTLSKIWRDADPNIPILKEAKAEYAKLQ